MGKALIIKGADFSANAIGRVEPPKPNLWTDLRSGNYRATDMQAAFSENDNYRTSQVIPVVASERMQYIFTSPLGVHKTATASGAPAVAVILGWLDSQQRLIGAVRHPIAEPINAYPGSDNKYASEYLNNAYGPGGQYEVAYMVVTVTRQGFGMNMFTEYTDEQIAACTLKEVTPE